MEDYIIELKCECGSETFFTDDHEWTTLICLKCLRELPYNTEYAVESSVGFGFVTKDFDERN